MSTFSLSPDPGYGAVMCPGGKIARHKDSVRPEPFDSAQDRPVEGPVSKGYAKRNPASPRFSERAMQQMEGIYGLE
jgi:hypothetical protein